MCYFFDLSFFFRIFLKCLDRNGHLPKKRKKKKCCNFPHWRQHFGFYAHPLSSGRCQKKFLFFYSPLFGKEKLQSNLQRRMVRILNQIINHQTLLNSQMLKRLFTNFSKFHSRLGSYSMNYVGFTSFFSFCVLVGFW